MPHRMFPPLKRDARPEEYREVVGQVSGTAVVKIEEHGLSGVRPIFGDPGIEPVTITVAARPSQVAPGRDGRRQPGCQFRETFFCAGVQRPQAEQRGQWAVDQMIKVEPIAARIPVSEAVSRAMNARQGYAIRARVGG